MLSCLQGTKACLGWDRVAAALTTGTTAVTDLWLQLLLRTIQVGNMCIIHLCKSSCRISQAASCCCAPSNCGERACMIVLWWDGGCAMRCPVISHSAPVLMHKACKLDSFNYCLPSFFPGLPQVAQAVKARLAARRAAEEAAGPQVTVLPGCGSKAQLGATASAADYGRAGPACPAL